MKFAPFMLTLFMIWPTFAGRIVTYTAVSTTSQEDANNAAVAGVAKQIVSQVNVNQTITKSESSRDGKYTLDEKFFSSNNVTSDIKLKGVTIIPEISDGKKFKATAKLDMDEFTSDIQFQMKRIQSEVSELEANARGALEKRLYGKVAYDLQKAQALLPEYEQLVWKLSKIIPLKESHKITHNLSEVESQFIAKLSGIKFELPQQEFTLTKPEMPEWSVLVSDSQGPLAGFPLIVRQGRQILSEKRSAENGRASFILRKVNFETGPYTLIVQPSLPAGYIKAAGLDEKLELAYTVSLSRCKIFLECNQIANLCRAAEIALNKNSIFSVNEENAAKIKISFSSTPRNSITSGNNVMNSYDVSIEITSEQIHFATNTKSVGKNEIDALIKATNKTDFSKLKEQLNPYCL